MSCKDPLTYLKLSLLKYRWKRGVLIQLYKVVHNINDIYYYSFFGNSHVNFILGDKSKIYTKGFYSTSDKINSSLQTCEMSFFLSLKKKKSKF